VTYNYLFLLIFRLIQVLHFMQREQKYISPGNYIS